MKWALLAGLALLLLAGFAGVSLLRMQRREKDLARRIAALGGKPREAAPAPIALVRPESNAKRSLPQRLAPLIGYNPERRDQYRYSWFVVLGVCAAAGRAAVFFAYGFAGILAWLALPLVAIAGCRLYYSMANGKRRNLLLAQFPDALALIVRAVRVGIPVPEALSSVAREALEPTRTEFDRLHKQILIGGALDTALRDMAARNDLHEYSFFAAALSLQAQTGGGLSETLETLADIIRKRIATRERGHALSSEARTSSMILGGLPAVVGGMLFMTSPDYVMMLVTDPRGQMLSGIAILSLSIGIGVMQIIINKALAT